MAKLSFRISTVVLFFLILAFTDERGELLQTRTINIEIPDRNRRRKASARKIGLQKLFDACISIMAASSNSWRLVVGRFGRLGHGELKGWNALLSKKSLLNACNQLKDVCPTCVPVSGHACRSDVEHPSILSACLVSLVADTSLTVMTDAGMCSYLVCTCYGGTSVPFSFRITMSR